MRNVRNRKGFTLIELIATIAIISILSVIAVFTYGKIQKNSQEKANYVNEEAIMKSAVSYADEYYNDSKYWVYRENNGTETFCVPVLDLANKGFLKEDDIKDISYSFILLTRGFSNKTIISEEYDKEGICGGSTDSSAAIQLVKVTTSSASVSAMCDDNGLVNYTYGLFDKNDNEINNYITKDNSYKFSGLVSKNKYKFKVKCNYQNSYSTDYSEGLEKTIGSTDLSFDIGNIEKDSDKIYKEVSINYTSDNIYKSENAKYYFRVNSNGNKSEEEVYECGNDISECTIKTTSLKKGYWYRTDSKSINLRIYNNSSIYARIWDGEIYSTNKSFQVTLPSNPYVNIDISHKLYDSYNGQYFGEEGNIINYYIDNWMSMPDISWNIYGGYATESMVYYSNSGNDEDDYSNRRSAGIDSHYSCNKNSCEFDKSKLGNNGGMQQFKIVVINKITRDKTIIFINVNIDKKAPILEIDNPTKGNWTNQNITVKLKYSDSHSGIDKSSIQWKDDKNNKNFEYVSYDENNGDIWSDEGNRVGYYKICDYADNCTEASTNIRIDRTSPTLNISNSSGGNWTNKNIITKLTYSDSASGIKDGSLAWKDNKNNTSWTLISNNNDSNYSDTWSDEGDRVGYYKICDKAGNCIEKSTNIRIDKSSPATPSIYNPTNGNWSKGNFSLTLSSSDSYSGIAYYQYTYNKNAASTGTDHDSYWVTYSNSNTNNFTTTPFTANRNQLVYVRACDNVGNCSDKSSTYIRIDNIAPSINVIVENSSANKSLVCNSNKCLIDFNTGTWYNNAPKISWTITDTNETYTYFYYNDANNYSDRTEYKTTNVISSYDGSTSKENNNYTINTGGKRQVAIVVKDVVGNQTMVVVDFNLDIINPTDPTTFTISNGNIVVSGSTDKESGFDHYFYSLWNSSWTTMIASGESDSISLNNITSAGTYYVYAGAKDKAGNVSGSPGRTISVVNRSAHYVCPSGYSWTSDYSKCYYTSSYSCTKTSPYSCCKKYCLKESGQWCNYDTFHGKKFCYSTESRCENGCGADCACRSYGTCYKKYTGTCYQYNYADYYVDYYYCPSDYTEYNNLCYKFTT